ncbi:membrane dipeptidase [Piscirickettsia litoralis]|uniref:membrane dipeptidase n=1 Tax=Piscirickettsia litoralis TaxID=1891921 RepID=UPI000ABC2B9D|nr:membrane dipeptidase [Piscirickettsia litoralis]
MCDHPRNISDEQIKICAEQGGVIGVTGISLFLNDDANISTQSIIAHIDYIAELVGPEHVGIGLDYVVDQKELDNFILNNPDSFKSIYQKKSQSIDYAVPEQLREIPELLALRGYPGQSIEKIMGGNFARIAKSNWL